MSVDISTYVGPYLEINTNAKNKRISHIVRDKIKEALCTPASNMNNNENFDIWLPNRHLKCKNIEIEYKIPSIHEITPELMIIQMDTFKSQFKKQIKEIEEMYCDVVRYKWGIIYQVW